MSSARRHCEPSAVTVDPEASHNFRPSSPCQQGIELNDSDNFSTQSECEVLIPTSDAFSCLEDDFASRLEGWGALRLDCQAGDIFLKLSEFLQSTRKELDPGLAPSRMTTIRPSMSPVPGKIVSLGKNHMLRGRPNKFTETKDPLSFQSIRALGHCRGFSFSPGDDSAGATLFNACRDQEVDNETKLSHPLTWREARQRERNESSESAKDEFSGATASNLRWQKLTEAVVSSAVGLGTSSNSQREASGKSIPTTRSSRSSSLSHRGYLNSNAENDRLREGSGRPGNSRLAVAAARAAKNRTVNE